MKILYFGTVCDLSGYEKTLEKCKTKPTSATIVFETALLSGLKSNGANVDVFSFPMIPVFPDSKLVAWGRRKEQLKCGYNCIWLRTINIPIIKQLSRQIDGRMILKKWMKANQDNESVFLIYSIPPFLVKDVLRYGKRYKIPCYAIIADLPRDMYMNHTKQGFSKWLKKHYLNRTLKLQGAFDGYVYLTEAMREVINSKSPYVVMEGIPDMTVVTNEMKDKNTKRLAIMYAGGLYQKYGILNLLDAFEKIERDDVELWLFGEGTASKIISERAHHNSKIRYFGQKNREVVLNYEKKADILVNPRSSQDEYTKYSFPSKIVEYMLSGTPVLTTKLSGIPQEYYPFLYLIDDNNVESLSKGLEEILNMSHDIRLQKGMDAKKFIVEQKNSSVQAKKILDFIKENMS